MRRSLLTSIAAACLGVGSPCFAGAAAASAPDAAPGFCQSLWSDVRGEFDQHLATLSVRSVVNVCSMDLRQAKQAVRTYTAAAAPLATLAQCQEYGLHLPAARVDPNRPLVVLIHGLDMFPAELDALSTLLQADGQQVASFGYPGDGPIEDDASLLADSLKAISTAHPAMKLNLIAYSMGGLVARDYVEGPRYAGQVDHLILLAPPNHGSRWARFELLLKAQHDWKQAHSDASWAPSWIVTEGLGEAGTDLLPKSDFLDQLNARPRRQGVRYTIIEGDQHPLRRVLADKLHDLAADVQSAPDSSINPPHSHWTATALAWCDAARSTVATEAQMLSADVRSSVDNCDGPVTLASAELPGVTDVVTLHADHGTIYAPDASHNPAAWPTIRARLAQ